MESGREPRELKPGDVLGRYQLLMPIAKGGMGQVWAARQSGTRGFQKLVAVKTILPSNEDAGQLESMLFDEASLASLVRHPNVAETLDLGEQDGTLYLVMEWVNGEPLDYILRASRAVGGIPIAIAVHLIVQACKGLHAAHEAKNSKGEHLGIVHRDISPQNLLVTYSGVVKLVDFGVAKATHQMSQPTALGQVKGKFAYMSPEQVHGETLDGRADVFAMGIVLYRITTGKHPFKSDNPAATIHNILTTGPELPSELVPGYPKRLEEVVMKALARDRAERFDSAHEMMLALEQALPTAVRAHSDKNTEVFLHRLFEQRIAERAATLRAALDDADAGTELSTPARQLALPRSQSTMRAVSVESIGEDVHFHSSILPPAPQVPSLRATGRLTRALVATLAAAATLVLATSASRLLHRAEGGLIGDATKGVVTGGAAAAPVVMPSFVAPQPKPVDSPAAPLATTHAEPSSGLHGAAASPAPSPSARPVSKKRTSPAMAVASPPAASPVAAPVPASLSPDDPLNRRK